MANRNVSKVTSSSVDSLPIDTTLDIKGKTQQLLKAVVKSNFDYFTVIRNIINQWSKSVRQDKSAKLAGINVALKEILKTLELAKRRYGLLEPISEENLIADVQFMANRGVQEDLALIQSIKDKPEYSSEEVQELLNKAEINIKNRLPIFQFLGQDTPFGDYPAPLVPIGYHKGDLAAAYPESKNAPFMILQEGTTYTEVEKTIYLKYNPRDEQFFSKANKAKDSEEINFDYREHRLFGLTETLVICYEADQEKDFYQHLLKDETFSQANPFLRRSLAKFTEDPDTIERELIHCIQYFNQENVQGMIPNWYNNEKEKLESIWANQGLEFPTLEQLEENARGPKQD